MILLIRALVVLLCLLAAPALAQDTEGPKPDRWRGMIIDDSQQTTVCSLSPGIALSRRYSPHSALSETTAGCTQRGFRVPTA